MLADVAFTQKWLHHANQYVVAAWDITDRKKAMETLNRLATVVRDSNDAIKLLDMNGNILTWNYGAENVYGYIEKEALSMNILSIVPEG